MQKEMTPISLFSEYKRVVLVTAALLLGQVLYAQVAANIIAQVDDVEPQGTITNINVPFINGAGQVGFTGQVDISGTLENFVYFNDQILFLDTDALPDVLSGGEAYMGIGDNMEFIYSPSFNGSDAVYTNNGLLAEENTQAPGFPVGTNSTFHSRPRMAPDGTAYWISGYNDGAGGTSSIGRIFYTASPGGLISVLLAGEQVIMGEAIDDGSGIDFDYNFSYDNSNFINVVNFDTGNTATDGAVLVNGSIIIAREATPNGNGDNWDNFDFVDINNNGNYVFCGDTDGATSSDEFLAVNGLISLREGNMVSGVTLGSSVRGLFLNNNDQLAYLWTDANGAEALFIANINDLLGSSQLVARTGGEIDTNDDGVSDFVLDDIVTFGTSISLTDDGRIFIEAQYTPVSGGVQQNGILEFPAGALPVDFLSFTAKASSERAVDLNWTTLSESENRGFEVLRSTVNSKESWEQIGFVSGRGSDRNANDYQFIDNNPASGENLYRLRQVDFDGSASFSSIATAMIDSKGASYEVYPTMVGTQLNYSNSALQPKVLITDMNGRQMRGYSNDSGVINFSASFPVGSYLVTFTDQNGTTTRRFIKSR